jgi:hypothetical protein
MKVLWLWGPNLVHVGDPKCGRFGRTSKMLFGLVGG